MRYSHATTIDSPAFSHDIRRIPGLAGLRRGAVMGWIRRLVLLSSDVLSVGFAWILARNLGIPTPAFLSAEGFELTLIPVLGISISIFAARSLYQAGEPRRDYLGMIKAQSLAVLLLLLTSYFFNPNQFVSRSQYLLYWGFSLVFLVLGRFVIDKGTQRLRLRGSIRYPAMVIADQDYRERAIQIVHGEDRYQVAGILDAKALDRDIREETFRKMQQLGIAEVFVAWDAIKNRMFLGQWFQTLGITLRVIPIEQNRVFGAANLHMLNAETPCITFRPPVIAGGQFWVKRIFDVTSALLILTLASPVYLAIAIAVFIDSPGPIFYKQTRVGLHGEPFKVWKFRSMVNNADKLQAQLEQQNETKDGVLFKVKDDPRITRVGHFIRQYSLDELPQIFNVLFGEMSLVGPRPLPLRDVEKFKQHYFIRQDVLPGITGMWQISGRSDIDNFDDVLKLDLYYIQNWSVLLDISILFRTLSAVLKKSGAY
ncbi:sugar transferase [Oscillatoria sp. CS-180]|uniref:sugar transferase n=1 Tax=Oscillatoria sp. CS-180 TaxID=3021720 RepID=UPI00232C7D07|nr:sugar transferase [Oscillatoria sp. CS-180]MDB9526421.1 sugar transferase [Oscillatoria sp. CS-180]